MLFACAKAGFVLVPLSWRLSPAELAYQLDDCEPALLLVEDEYAALGDAALAEAAARPVRRRLGEPGEASGKRRRRRRRRRCALPDLHVRDDGEAQGGASHPRQLLLDEPRLRPGHRDLRRGRRAAGVAPVPLRRLERAAPAHVVEGRARRSRAELRPGTLPRADRGEARDDGHGRAGDLSLHVPGACVR